MILWLETQWYVIFASVYQKDTIDRRRRVEDSSEEYSEDEPKDRRLYRDSSDANESEEEPVMRNANRSVDTYYIMNLRCSNPEDKIPNNPFLKPIA